MNPPNPDQISKPEQYAEAVSLSKNYRISIDVGDAVGGGWTPADVLKFVREQHDRIFQIYLKDRNKANVSLPWGDGDTPLKELLLLMRDNHYNIHAYVDNDYASPRPRSEDVKRSFEWAKAVLAG
jgi:sugar phosphate isomerase/epimerase